MFSEKESLELAEKMMEHMAEVEKYQIYTQNCPDSGVRQLVQQHLQVLQQHYFTLQSMMNQQFQQNYDVNNNWPQQVYRPNTNW